MQGSVTPSTIVCRKRPKIKNFSGSKWDVYHIIPYVLIKKMSTHNNSWFCIGAEICAFLCWYEHVTLYPAHMILSQSGERGGSVVECRTPEREVRGSRPTAAVLCPWARHFTPRKYWLITQEAMAPSRYDWKIVDWDVKPQHNQPIVTKRDKTKKMTYHNENSDQSDQNLRYALCG